MNVLLFYPRLLIALLQCPAPRTMAQFHHWNMAQLFHLWNEPWHDANDSLAMEALRRRTKEEVDASDGRARRAATLLRILYLVALFYWPLLSLIVSIRRGKSRFLSYWNQLINTLFLFSDWDKNYDISNSITLTHFSLYLPVLYAATKTRRPMPDTKRLMFEACQRTGLPTPHVYKSAEELPTAGNFIVKPIAGFSGKGIIFTNDPTPYFGDENLIVQEVVRNPPELRQFWATSALGTIRTMSIYLDGRYQLAGPAHIKIPVGDAVTDNFGSGNVFAMIDDTGRLSELHKTRHPSPGIEQHPTTGIASREVVIPRYRECIELALLAHERLAPHLPFFNADVAITEHGPMVIEINRVPGLPTAMFTEEIAMKFVRATAQSIERLAGAQPSFARFEQTAAYSSAAT